MVFLYSMIGTKKRPESFGEAFFTEYFSFLGVFIFLDVEQFNRFIFSDVHVIITTNIYILLVLILN